MPKNTLSAKVGDRTLERLEDYADEEGISKSEATDRMVKQGLDVEESDMRLVPVRADGSGTVEDVQKEVSRAQDEITTTQAEIQELKSSIKTIGPALMIALGWIGAEISVGIPGGTPVVVGSGLLVALLMLYSYSKTITDD
jgi:hypothetical protein